MTDSPSPGFGALSRARQEAARYGRDDWVFVRELLQNARDAGARRVEWRVERDDGVERLICRDDGEGMSAEHARRYLFTLYASIKRGASRAAGRFGIGFWSVLRFGPTRIQVGSRPADGPGWWGEFGGRLEHAVIRPSSLDQGTEVRLERPDSGLDLAARVAEAVRSDAPFLRCRDAPEQALEVLVAGRSVSRELELPPPSVHFRRPGLCGAVGLGPSPEVRLFAHGLRVRTAAHLDELLAREVDRRGPTEIEGLLPQVWLDSDRIELLLARGDARDDRELERLVTVARAELDRFLRRELDRVAPRGLPRRLVGGVRRGLARVPRGWTGVAGATVLLAALASVAGSVLVQVRGGERTGLPPPPAAGAPRQVGTAGYAGLGDYPGPSVEPLAGVLGATVAYRPERARPYLAVLRFAGLDRRGRPHAGSPAAKIAADGPVSRDDDLEIELVLAAPAGLLRLPEPTGARVDPGSVRLDGRPVRLWRTDRDEPAIELDRPTAGRLLYRVVPAPAATLLAVPPGAWPEPPLELEPEVALLAALPAAARPAAAQASLAQRLRYDRSPETAAALREASGSDDPLLARVLAAGAGDCDVLAAVAGAMLAATGLPVRLAIGWVGADGQATGSLHAWLEVGLEGTWQVLDATVGVSPAAGRSPPPAAAPGLDAPRPLWPWAAAATVAVGMALVVLRQRRRTVRRRRDGAGVDLAGLLRGALGRPDAFAGVGDLEGRALVPLLDGRRLPLRRARELARGGRLAAGFRHGATALRAADRGAAIVDLDDEAGRVVAEGLGAHDLKLWDEPTSRPTGDDVTAAVESALRRLGLRFAVLKAPALGEPAVVLRGPAARAVLGRDLVVFDRTSPAMARLSRHPPELAALALAEEVAGLLDLGEERRRRLLAALAEAAVAAAGRVG